MTARSLMKLGLLSLLGILGLTAGCTCCGASSLTVGDLKTERKAIDLDGAEEITLELEMEAGKLTIRSGAEGALEGEFSYNVAEWKPRIEYQMSGRRGKLKLSQHSPPNSTIGSKARNEWDLMLNGEIPLTVRIEVGAGNGSLDFSELDLRNLRIEAGVGNFVIDVSGDRQQDIDVDIEGGVGNIEVIVPERVGVRLDRDMGVGTTDAPGFHKRGGVYVNDAYGETEATINIRIEAGVGMISIHSSRRGFAST